MWWVVRLESGPYAPIYMPRRFLIDETAWSTDRRSDAECVAAAMRILGYAEARVERVGAVGGNQGSDTR